MEVLCLLLAGAHGRDGCVAVLGFVRPVAQRGRVVEEELVECGHVVFSQRCFVARVHRRKLSMHVWQIDRVRAQEPSPDEQERRAREHGC